MDLGHSQTYKNHGKQSCRDMDAVQRPEEGALGVEEIRYSQDCDIKGIAAMDARYS